jgi:glucan phosphoethanolaminetransferase (alkaline phosphatase superfamily)
MPLTAERNRSAVVNDIDAHAAPGNASFGFRAACALVLMTAAANSFLKYLWWTAYYGTLSGIHKLSAQSQAADSRASFYGWSLIVLEIAAILLIYTLIRFRHTGLFRKATRLLASSMVAVIGTGFLALVLSWIKQAH